MFWIGFLVGILVIPAIAFLVFAVLFSIDLIPYTIKVIKKYFYEKKVKKGLIETEKSEEATSEELEKVEVEIKEENENTENKD
ncbi:MAG: hypothetical protein IKI95_02005 [Clostridia bacterium]|nr:hypothetical protein [Clostridia bacterium]